MRPSAVNVLIDESIRVMKEVCATIFTAMGVLQIVQRLRTEGIRLRLEKLYTRGAIRRLSSLLIVDWRKPWMW
jgi:hypothetical protein